LLHICQILTEECLRIPLSSAHPPILKRGILEKTQPDISTNEMNRFYLTGKK
jgi:hypothetical protein